MRGVYLQLSTYLLLGSHTRQKNAHFSLYCNFPRYCLCTVIHFYFPGVFSWEAEVCVRLGRGRPPGSALGVTKRKKAKNFLVYSLSFVVATADFFCLSGLCVTRATKVFPEKKSLLPEL